MKTNTLIQFIKFGLVGVVNTLTSYGIYSVLFYLGVNPLICNIPAFVISVFVSFLLNNRFVFRENEHKEKRKWYYVLIKTYISYSFTGLFLAEVLTFLWLSVVHIERFCGVFVMPLSSMGITLTAEKIAGYLVPILNLVISIPINFLLNKFWAYHQKNKEEDAYELKN